MSPLRHRRLSLGALLLAACLAFGTAPAGAAGEAAPGLVTIGRLHYGGGGDWYANPSSLPNLLREFGRRTSIAVAGEELVLRVSDPALERVPLIYATGHGNISFTPDEEQRLRDWLLRGGFFWADDNYGLDPGIRRAVGRLFPEEPLRLVPADHPIYHSFYDLRGVPKIHEHDGKPPQGWGVFLDGRLVFFYTYEADIGDGLEDPQVHKDPPDTREAAMKMAVNVLYHVLTESR